MSYTVGMRHTAPRWLTLLRGAACLLAVAIGAVGAQYVPHVSHARGAHPIVDAEAFVRVPAPAPLAPDPDDIVPVLPTRAFDPVARDLAHGRIIEGGTPHRMILFTFDDGPDRRTTPRLLDTLDAEGIKAVFFVTTGRFQDRTPRHREQADILREIVRRGHVIGNHSVNHIQLPTLDDAAFALEIDGAARMIEREIGVRPWLVRPPGGSRSLRVDARLAERGYTSVLWNLGTGDPQTDSPNVVFQTFFRVLERRERENGERGGIVLMHDTYDYSVEAFPRIVAELRARNCALLAANEELYDFVPDPRYFHVPRAGANTSTVAPPAIIPADEFAARQARLREETRARCAR